MHLGDLGVSVTYRIGQRGRRPGPAEENDAGFGRWAPVTVIAGDQDLIALWVDVFHETVHLSPAALEPNRTRSPWYVLDDVRRQDVGEQLTPSG